MRVSNFSWALCATILVAGSAQADRADEPSGMLDDAPRFMLYVHKEIGSKRHKSTGPSFGFAVDRPIPLTLHRDQSALRASSARIFDLRVAPFDGGAVMFNGLRLTGGTAQGLGYSGSYEEDPSWSWSNPYLLFAVVIGGAVGISCATDNWPCDSGGSGYRVGGE